MSLLTTLKNKPAPTKSFLAFTVALGVTVVVTGFWALSLPARFGDIGTTVSKLSDVVDDQSAVVVGVRDAFEELFETAAPSSTAPTSSITHKKARQTGLVKEDSPAIIFKDTTLMTGTGEEE
jgi:hypothetical protein